MFPPDLTVELGGFSILVTYYQRGASSFGTSSLDEVEVSVLVTSSIANSIDLIKLTNNLTNI